MSESVASVLWRRHWLSVALTVPLGIVIGLGIGMVSETILIGWGPRGWSLVPGAGLGLATAIAADVGATGAAIIRARRVGKRTAAVGATALGAGVGAATFWVVIGVVLSLPGGGFLALFVAAPIGLVCGLASAGIAAAAAALPLPAGDSHHATTAV